MTKDQIKQRKRQLAEQDYHASLKNIDQEVEQKYAEYEVQLALINAMEKRMQTAFDHQRKELAGKFGLLLPTEQDEPATEAPAAIS